MRKNKGITLIVLVITIIILVILAGVAISQLTGNGLFGKTKQANQKTRYANAKEIVNLKLMEIQVECTEKKEEYNIVKIAEGMKLAEDITIEKYYNKEKASIEDEIPENLTDLEGLVVSVNEYSEYKFLIGEECKITGVIEGELGEGIIIQDFTNIEEFEVKTFGSPVENSTNTLKFSYQETKREGNKAKILITLEDNENGIEKIIFSNQDELIYNNSKEEIEIEYEVEIGKEDKIKIVLGNGKEKEEKILVENKIIDYWPLTSNLKNTIQNRDNMEVTEGQVSFDDGVYLDGNTTIETMNNYILPKDGFSVSIEIKDIKKFNTKRYAWILNMGAMTYSSLNSLNAFGFIYDSYYPNLAFIATNGIWSATNNGQGKLYDDGNWHTLIGVYDSSTCILYKDFEKVGRINNNVNKKINIDLSSKMGISKSNADASTLQGYFRNLKIYNYALTEEEIQEMGQN